MLELLEVLSEPVFNICKTGLYFDQLCCVVGVKGEIDLGVIHIKIETDMVFLKDLSYKWRIIKGQER